MNRKANNPAGRADGRKEKFNEEKARKGLEGVKFAGGLEIDWDAWRKVVGEDDDWTGVMVYLQRGIVKPYRWMK